MRRRLITMLAILSALVSSGACDAGDGDPGATAPSASALPSATRSPLFDPPMAFSARPVTVPAPARMYQVANGVAYVVGDNALAAYDLAAGGNRLWSSPLAGPPIRLGHTGPVIAQVDGKPVTFVTYRVRVKGSGTTPDRNLLRLASFNLADGAPGWQTDVDDDRLRPDHSDLGVDKVVAASAEHVVVSTDSYDTGGTAPDFSAIFDARTGKLRWANPAFQARALDGDVVVGKVAGEIKVGTAGLSAGTGKTLWTRPQSRPAGEIHDGFLGNGLLHLVNLGGGVDSIVEIGSGRDAVRLPQPARGASYVCRHSGSVIVCGQHDGKTSHGLYAYDANSFTLLWKLPEGGRIAPVLTAARASAVYGYTGNGPLILDARTGKDAVTDLAFTPTDVVPGFGLIVASQGIEAYPATR